MSLRIVIFALSHLAVAINFDKLFYHSSKQLQQRDEIISTLRLRCGRPGTESIWLYSGVIRNPSTGSEIIGVQGLEITKRLSNIDNTSSSSIDLEFKSPSGSYLSKKLFIYTNILNDTQPITSYRIRKHSPLRPVTPTKSIHQLISFRVNDNTSQIAAIVEYPGGRIVKSDNVMIKEHKIGMLPWMSRRSVDLTCFLVSKRTKKKSMNRWISFAPSSEGSGKSQEYYALSPAKHLLDQHRAYLKCTKYGECPAWFAPGRSCCTELSGASYSSMSDIPKAKRDFFISQCPTFFDGRLDLENFRHNAVDILDAYQPWYHPITSACQSLLASFSKK